MAAVIGALRAILSANLVEWNSGLAKGEKRLQQFGKKVSRFGRNMTKAGAAMSAVTTAPLLAFAKKSLTAFQAQEDAIAAVEAGLKSMGDASGFTSQQLQKMASDMQAVTTFGDEEILRKATANLLTFGNISGDVFQRTQALALDLSALLGKDLQQSSIMLGKALNDPVKGLAALREVGIAFTDQQIAMAKEMAKTGDLAGAQQLILAELEKQYGSFAEELAKTTSGQVDQAVNKWGDFQERIGEIVARALPPLLDMLDRVLTFLEGLSKEQLEWGVTIGAAVAAIGPLVVALGGLLAALGPIISIVGTVGGAIAALAGGPLVAIVAAIGAVVVAWRNWETIGPMVENLWARFQASVNSLLFPILDKIKEPVRAVMRLFMQWDEIVLIVQRVYEGIKLWLVDKLSAVWDAVRSKIDQVKGWFKSMADFVVLGSIVPDMVDGIRDEFGRLDDVMVTPAKTAANAVQQAFQGLGSKLEELFDEFVETGKISFDTLKRMALDLAKQLFVTPFLNSIAGGIGSLFGGGATGGGILSGLFGGFRADGGRVTPNKSFLVGEEGPELFRPSTAGTIVPNSAMGMAGPTTYHQEFNITTPDADSFRHSKRQIARLAQQRFAPS